MYDSEQILFHLFSPTCINGAFEASRLVGRATHHVEDGVNHEVDGHDGGRPPVLDRAHTLLVSSAQEL